MSRMFSTPSAGTVYPLYPLVYPTSSADGLRVSDVDDSSVENSRDGDENDSGNDGDDDKDKDFFSARRLRRSNTHPTSFSSDSGGNSSDSGGNLKNRNSRSKSSLSKIKKNKKRKKVRWSHPIVTAKFDCPVKIDDDVLAVSRKFSSRFPQIFSYIKEQIAKVETSRRKKRRKKRRKRREEEEEEDELDKSACSIS